MPPSPAALLVRYPGGRQSDSKGLIGTVLADASDPTARIGGASLKLESEGRKWYNTDGHRRGDPECGDGSQFGCDPVDGEVVASGNA